MNVLGFEQFESEGQSGESMKYRHTPQLDARYWTAITLASVFGTNLGDFYAHESELGIGKGLVMLALLAAVAFLGGTLRHPSS